MCDMVEPIKMRLAIVGSRNFNDYKAFRRGVRRAFRQWGLYYEDVEFLISGGCSGADRMAEEWTKSHGFVMEVFLPDWYKYGKAAGPLRNSKIIDRATHVIAFPSKYGRGTQDSIRKANIKGIPVYVEYVD